MSGDQLDVFLILQPDLLTTEDLIRKIQSRCCRIKNLELMSKEELVGLFRRVILPLPQRFYRTNRRGKMLSSCRAKAGLETGKKDEGRLKPPPDVSDFRKIQISSNKNERSHSESTSLDNIIIKDRRKSIFGDERREGEGQKNLKFSRSDFPSEKKIILKRPSRNEKLATQSEPSKESKKQRTAIEWP